MVKQYKNTKPIIGLVIFGFYGSANEPQIIVCVSLLVVGKVLKTMRRKCNFSQEQISKKIGYARNTISQYETETIQPDFATIEKIANECGYEIYFYNKKTDDKLTTENINRKEI